MTKTTRFTLLLAAAALGGLFLAAGVRAEPPGGEGEGGEKVPFVRTAAPGAKHNWSFECTASSSGDPALGPRFRGDDGTIAPPIDNRLRHGEPSYFG